METKFNRDVYKYHPKRYAMDVKYGKHYGSKKLKKKKLFKSIDDKFEAIGFKKYQDDKYCVEYRRRNKKYNYTQILYIGHKASGRHIIQSYDNHLFDNKGIGNTCVGLTYYETKLALKKMKQKKWKSR